MVVVSCMKKSVKVPVWCGRHSASEDVVCDFRFFCVTCTIALMNGDQNPATPPTGWQYRPGDTVTSANPAPASQPSVQNVQVSEPVATPGNVQTSSGVEALPTDTEQPPVDSSLLHELAENAFGADESATASAAAPEIDHIEWTASEYVAHQKTTKWYTVLMLTSVVAAIGAYLLTKDIISAVSIVLIALVFALTASHKPRVLTYRLDPRGLTIAQKTYEYGQFRSFAIVDEGAFSSIMLVPLKRFMPMISIYYEPADEAQIIKVLSDRLPLEQWKRDVIDSLLHKIRF